MDQMFTEEQTKMRKLKSKAYLLVILFLSSIGMNAQQENYSIDISAGSFGYNSTVLINEFTSETNLEGSYFLVSGVKIFQLGEKQHSSINAGLEFKRVEQNERSISFVNLPLLYGYKFGNKTKGILNAGFSFDIPVSTNGWDSDRAFERTSSSLILTGQLKLGAQHQISDDYIISLSGVFSRNLSKLYENQYEVLPEHASYREDMNKMVGISVGIEAGLIFLLNNDQ